MFEHDNAATTRAIHGKISATSALRQVRKLEAMLQPGREDLFKAAYPDEMVSTIKINGRPLTGSTINEQREHLRGILSKCVTSMRGCLCRSVSGI